MYVNFLIQPAETRKEQMKRGKKISVGKGEKKVIPMLGNMALKVAIGEDFMAMEGLQVAVACGGFGSEGWPAPDNTKKLFTSASSGSLPNRFTVRLASKLVKIQKVTESLAFFK
jgi:hypothetical protein